MPNEAKKQEIIELAAAHGLRLDPGSLTVNEAGLDYRVAMARAADGADWVLRIPRRTTISPAAEARILEFVRTRIEPHVPDWKIVEPGLIAYPRLPGHPALTLDPASREPIWHVEATDLRYAAEVGRLIAQLHRIPVEEARAAGLIVQSPEEVRTSWAARVDTVCSKFTVAETLRTRWRRWIAEDSYWPKHSVFTHGELYQAHVLVDASTRIVGVLDWTTAKVADPAVDLMFQHLIAGAAGFATTIETYQAEGGVIWDRLAEHCAELVSTSPLAFAEFALATGEPEHLASAAAQLNPETPPQQG